jgi:hypothetical protein
MFEFNDPLPECKPAFSTKKIEAPVFSFNSVDDLKKPFAENSQTIRNSKTSNGAGFRGIRRIRAYARIGKNG